MKKTQQGNLSAIASELCGTVQDMMDKTLYSNETLNYELEFRTKTNEVRYLLVNATTRRDVESNIVGVVGVAKDLNESSKNVVLLSRWLTSFVVDTANAPIFGVDMNGNVNEWNNKTAEITGFAKDNVLGEHLVETIIVPSIQQSVQEVFDKAFRGVETSNYELELETNWKEVRHLLVNVITRIDKEKIYIGIVGVAQDVTESAKNDRAMFSMEIELRQLVDTANTPIFGINVDGNVNEWNDKTAEIAGFTKDKAFGQPLVKTLIVPSLQPFVQEILDNALKGIGNSNYELEL